MLLTLQAFVGLTLVLPVLGQPDPCTNYQDINEPLRSIGYKAGSLDYDHLICDRLLAEDWYRFTSAAGGQMPTTCQDVFHCGTHVPLWLHGTHPTVADGIVTRAVCGNQPIPGTTGCCNYQETIQVKNCGSFYVYKLKPTRGCSIAYCAGTGTPCPPDKWSPSGFEPGCIDAYPKMTQSPTLSNPIVKTNTFEFNCHVNYDPTNTSVGFDIQWLFDGKPDTNVPKSHITGAQRDAALDQKFLVGHLGETLSCKVDTYFLTSPGRKGPGIPSNGYWMGIKLSESRLVVGEHEKPKEVKMISTIPIICDQSSVQSCHLEVYLEPNNHDFKTTTACTVNLRPTDWNPVTNQAVAKFEVLAERDFKNDKDKNLMLHFSPIFSVDSPAVFNGYQIPYMQVITEDKQTSMCSCTGDPHCITLDRHNSAHLSRSYYNYYKIGEFVMYKSTSRPFEVQVRTWQCNRVSCACAVMMREGNDVVKIDMCHGSYGHTFPRLTIPNKSTFSQGTVVQKDAHGNKWVISFPSGAQVTVTNVRNIALNVYVTAPEDDYGNTGGLCGTFDSQVSNDLTSPSGHVYPWSTRPSSFAESWRIPIGSSMFDKVPQPDPKWNNNIYYCDCNQAKKQVDCRIDNKASRPALHTRCPGCTVVVPTKTGNSGKRKRLAAASGLTDDQPLQYFFDYGVFYNPVTRNFPTPSGITHANATDICTKAFLRSATVRECIARAGYSISGELESCVEDIKLMDDLSFVHSYVETIIISCQEKVLKDPSFYNNATGDPPAFITTDLCPSDCSGHGTCAQGTCNCDPGYVGDDCLINNLIPPTLYNIIGSSYTNTDSDNCDIRQRPCKAITVVGENIRNHPSKCHLDVLEFQNGRFINTGRVLETAVDFDTSSSVVCHMPSSSQIGGKDVTGYNVSLTNNGHTYSNQIQAFIIDSSCMYCSDEGGACSIKPNTCLIDGYCRHANEHKAGDSSRACKPDVNTYQWTVTVHTAHPPAATKAQSQPPAQTMAKSTRPSAQTTAKSTQPPAQTTAKSTQPPAPVGGKPIARPDIWTLSSTGCECSFNKSRTDCACCDVDACQCTGTHVHQCVQCGQTHNCGNALPAPDNGVDGYTLAMSDCKCNFNTTLYHCACCQNNGCQCDRHHSNQCVKCGHMEQCGNKPWLFGPAI